ncbi:family 16 glycoside hydrolase [uncultured Winogradskyella sp.]|uniref:family 16 glycoside hydrolase n=1 Tax=uncultured Winogradskyella sp. TaxID=395353 RepID=UPI002620BF08|nr:family 16 glycoside hydrolase [uncultured Winogradskyella sp.]
MKNSIIIVVMLTLICTNSCKEKNNEQINDELVEGVYDAIFLDINNTLIDSTINPEVKQIPKKLSNINLTSRTHFIGDTSNFMLRGLGALKISDAGDYYFRLTSSGKVKLQLNNVDLVVHNEFHEQSSKIGKRKINIGNAIFDYEYFPGKLEPHLVLEWSRDGEKFEVIPNEFFDSADLGKTKIFNENNEDTGLLNTLSDEEKANGWQLLFDGKSLNGWHTYNKPDKIGNKWIVEDGTLKFEGYDKYFTYYLGGVKFDYGNENKERDGGLDIVTDESFENFELNLEWKISKHGNSGIFYTIQELDEYDEGWKSSPEMQVLDDQGQKDGLITSHRAGDLYDLIPSSERRTRAHGEWNRVKIIKNKGVIEHWLNGEKVVAYDTNSPSWKEMIENSKFSSYKENYAVNGPGKIGLQDHTDTVWYRNIKIKKLD